MTLAHRVGPLLASVAPPGSAQRRVLKRGYRALHALPELFKPRYLAQRVAMIGNRSSLQLALIFCRDPLEKERMRSAADCRWRSILGSLEFPVLERPRVSVIIPVFNQYWKTLECLQAISQSPGGPSYEVIVVDDRSTDRTLRVLRSIPGLITVKNARRLGRNASCNRGAFEARGEYLAFLDPDALVMPGWLSALAQTFEVMPRTGLAGAKLILPDGRLLEAGGTLWRDGGGTSYGKFGDVDHPSFNFAREVDYCSGGCLMVPRALFFEIGGFNTAGQADAHEEIDLALRVSHAGHKVIYQPLARVVQCDRARPEARVSPQAGSHQEAGQSFRERWRERLDHHPEAGSGGLRLARARAGNTANLGQVLVIDHRIPTVDRDCGSLRMVEIMRRIRQAGHHVVLVPDNPVILMPYIHDLQSEGIEIVLPPHYESAGAYLEQHGHDFDLAIISRADVAEKHMATVRRLAPRAKIVFDTVDLHFLREERQAGLNRSAGRVREGAAAIRKDQELRLARSADLTLVVSPIEKAVLEKESGNQIDVRILPTIYPVGAADPPDWKRRRDVVFIGGFAHVPNIDAVLFFTTEIFPLIRARIPDAVFKVIGPDPTPEICQLASPAIQVLGFVPDVKPIFDQALVSVAPIRFGAGVKGKVNQSMSFGVPTVVTSIAAEGMHLTHGENALFADDPAGFADAVVRLWTSPELWRKVSRNGLQNLAQHFSVEAAAAPIDDLLRWAGLQTLAVK